MKQRTASAKAELRVMARFSEPLFQTDNTGSSRVEEGTRHPSYTHSLCQSHRTTAAPLSLSVVALGGTRKSPRCCVLSLEFATMMGFGVGQQSPFLIRFSLPWAFFSPLHAVGTCTNVRINEFVLPVTPVFHYEFIMSWNGIPARNLVTASNFNSSSEPIVLKMEEMEVLNQNR